MPIAARIITDKAVSAPPRLTQRTGSLFGEINYWVPTRGLANVLAASGLPAIGDPWPLGGVSNPLFGCSSITYADHEGVPNATLGEPGGATIVTATWETPQFGGGGNPVSNEPYTVVESRQDTDLRRSDVRNIPGDPPVDPLPINDGKGAQIKIGRVVAKVVTFRNPTQVASAYARMIRLSRRCALNNGPIVLPRVLGTTNLQFSLAAREAQYQGFEIDASTSVDGDEKVRVVHLLELAPAGDFDFISVQTDGKGNIIEGSARTNQIYVSDNFGGLW